MFIRAFRRRRIVSIRVLRIGARDGHELPRESIADDLRAYLSMCIRSTDIREHFTIGRASALGAIEPCVCGAWSLLLRWARMNPCPQPSRRIARTARFNAACISSCEGDRDRRRRQHEVSRQRGRAVREGMVGGGDAASSRSPADAARARRRRTRSSPVSWDERPRSDRVGVSRDAGRVRPRCRRRVRRRIADQREGVPAGKVRARGARHGEHRLQRPVLHVVGGRRRHERAGRRSRPAVSTRRHSAMPKRFCSSAATWRRRCRRSCGTSRRSSATAAR